MYVVLQHSQHVEVECVARDLLLLQADDLRHPMTGIDGLVAYIEGGVGHEHCCSSENKKWRA
jgi:hypothetical protein